MMITCHWTRAPTTVVLLYVRRCVCVCVCVIAPSHMCTTARQKKMHERNANCMPYRYKFHVCGDMLQPTHSPNRTSGDTVPTTRTATTKTNEYKNDLHIGTTVDNLLFATRHKTDVSENHNGGKKIYTHDANGSEWSWNKEENYLTYMHRNGCVSEHIPDDIWRVHEIALDVWHENDGDSCNVNAPRNYHTHSRARTHVNKKNGKRSDNKSHSQNYGLSLSLSLSLCVYVDRSVFGLRYARNKKHIILDGRKEVSINAKQIGGDR